MFQEYEKQDTREAKTVKDLDRFEMILQAYEYELNHTREEDSTYLEEFYISTAGIEAFRCQRSDQILPWLSFFRQIPERPSGPVDERIDQVASELSQLARNWKSCRR